MSFTRRSALAWLGAGTASLALEGCKAAASPIDLRKGWRLPQNSVDLTHTLSPAFPFIPVQNKTFPFRMSPIATLESDGVYANRWELTEHVGTHLDAPCHFQEGGLSVEQIPINDLIQPLVVISIAQRAATNSDAALKIDDLARWERANGRIPDRAAVFLHTGWETRARNARKFVNTDASGTMHFPGFSAGAAEFLLTRRIIAGIGVDTLSIDVGTNKGYPVHKRLFSAGKWAVECLANLSLVPAAGAFVVVAPVKVLGASGAPARVVAFW